MKNLNDPTMVLDLSSKLRRSKSRDVNSRFQSPSSSFDAGNRSPVQLSPVRRKPDLRKTTRPSQLDDLTSLRGLWPAASSSKVDTLADHLGHERLNDIIERNRGRSQTPELIPSKYEDKDTKENHIPIAMSHKGNHRFTSKSSSFSSVSKLFSDELSSELGEACSKAYSRARGRGVEVASKYMNDTRQRRVASETNSMGSSMEQKALRRTSSQRMGYGSAKTQWALSPGRSESPRLSVESKGVMPVSFSSSKPRSSPLRSSSGVEKLFSLGMEFFKSKKSSSSSFSSLPVSSPKNSMAVGPETGWDFWLLQNRLMQWRFANARADYVHANQSTYVESNLVCASECLRKLQHSVTQKRIKLNKEKLEMKLNIVLQSQFKLLECWGRIERQHSSAISNAKESLHSVVCMVPLIEGAKMDAESAAKTFQQALQLGSSIKLMLSLYSPLVEKNAKLVSELAKVVAQEKLLLEECLELLRDMSILEVKERSLKCGITQMESWKRQQNHKHGQVGLEISSL